jgi:hypothetical protein
MSARISTVFDWDGSLSGTGKQSLVASHRNWWDDTEVPCNFTQWNVWRCDWDSVAYGNAGGNTGVA